ncbi:MAG: hypothetical protein KJ905_00290 [Nanoarchaeota archaeon]|nr:hypothetical protein [Nanoarchaeota archaeon]MBU1501199.1 hypothetical protein [Nanoarchaeota archaeon]MBU2458916.1 hypothetical protein [Nanoarchaeota archaeon]
MIDAKYFDIFGLAGFLILFFIGLSIRKMFKGRAWAVIIISLIGIVVDGYIVLTNFVLK